MYLVMEKVKKVLNVFSYILIGLILLFVVYLAISTFMKKEICVFGRRVLFVKSGSMEPTIPAGSVFMSEERDFTNLDNHTIITFEFDDGDGIFNTHRIVGYYYEYEENGQKRYDSSFDYETMEDFYKENPNCKIIGYRTKGDNPTLENPDFYPVMFEDIKGVYVRKMPIFSFLYRLTSTFIGFILLIFSPLLILLVPQVINVFKAQKEENDSKESS